MLLVCNAVGLNKYQTTSSRLALPGLSVQMSLWLHYLSHPVIVWVRSCMNVFVNL